MSTFRYNHKLIVAFLLERICVPTEKIKSARYLKFTFKSSEDELHVSKVQFAFSLEHIRERCGNKTKPQTCTLNWCQVLKFAILMKRTPTAAERNETVSPLEHCGIVMAYNKEI